MYTKWVGCMLILPIRKCHRKSVAWPFMSPLGAGVPPCMHCGPVEPMIPDCVHINNMWHRQGHRIVKNIKGSQDVAGGWSWGVVNGGMGWIAGFMVHEYQPI